MKIGVNSFFTVPVGLHAPFNCVRLYNDMDFTQNERGLYTYAPTKKDTDFNYDTFISTLNAQGKSVMLTTHKKAQWLGAGKYESKPLETGANPEDPLSYTIFSQHLYQQQARYGKTVQPLENIKTFRGIFNGVYQNQPLTGLGYDFSQMWLNETNADWWTDAEYWTPKQLAAVASASWDGHGGAIPLGGIMTADPLAHVVFPALAFGTRKGLTIRQYVEAFLNEFWTLRPDLVGILPFHAMAINYYGRLNNKGADPFDTTLYDEMRWWKTNYPQVNLHLTEFGYDEIKPSRQCPDNYPSMDIYQTKNEMIKRGILLADAAGVDEFYIYMIRDTNPPDSGLYRTCGVHTTSQTGYQKKPSYHFLAAFIPEHKTFESITKTGARTLNIDGTNFSYNANGTTTEVTQTPMLTIQNNKLYKDGQPFFIRELNSPETLLRLSQNDFKAIVDYAASVGLNTIYCSLYAGDKYKTTLHPYNGAANFGNPTSGFAEARLLDWREKLEYAASKGFVLHLLLSEKENHFVHTDAQQHAFIDKMVATFGHLPVIWDREEFPTGKDAWIENHFNYLRIKDANNIVAIHNNTGEKPWFGHSNIIDLLSIQADISSFDSIIKTETANGFAAYASEMTGGFQANDTAKAERIRTAGGDKSSGAGIYIASLDQDATLPQLKAYEPVYKALSGTTPNPTTMKIGYSTKADRSDFKELVSGQSITAGSIYIEAREAAPPVSFMFFKEGVQIKTQTENGAPYDLYGGASYNAGNGSYSLMVIDKNNPSPITVNFTVGTVTPPTEAKGISFVLKDSGQIEFSFEGGIKVVVTPD